MQCMQALFSTYHFALVPKSTRVGTGKAEDFRKKKGTKATQATNEELTVTQTEGPTVCPVTRLPLEHPLRNRVCGHIYSRKGADVILCSKNPKYAKSY